MGNEQRVMSPGQWLLLCLLGLIWGSSYFFIKVAVGEVGTLALVMWRCALGAAALLLLMSRYRLRLPTALPDWLALLVLAVINSALPFMLITWGETVIDSGLAAMLTAATPLFAVLLLRLLNRRERLTVARLGGLLTGLAGVVLLIGPAALHGLGSHLLAESAVLLAALCYAAGAIYTRQLKHLPALTIASGQLLLTALIMLPAVLWVEQPWLAARPGPAALWSLAALGLVCTALALPLYFYLVAKVGAANATLVTYLIPASATLLGVLVLHEQIGLGQIGGMTLIALGLALTDPRPLQAVLGFLRLGRTAMQRIPR